MAEWFKRGTVNTFYRGSNPLKALKIYNFLSFILKINKNKLQLLKKYYF